MTVTNEPKIWDREVILKYNISGPRYTSYPTAVQFEDFDPTRTLEIAQKHKNSHKSLSLYVHVPFCRHICFYCGCNKIATKDPARADAYLDILEKEMQMLAPYFSERPVRQLHWGGGTPTFLSVDQIKRLFLIIKKNFSLLADDLGEYSIEIDPRVTSRDQLVLLRELGFNRISLGVQDFNPDTQVAINRLQSYDMVSEMMHIARQNGFFSVSFDLIYGLPKQTRESFDRTIEQVIALNPDRIAVYNYAHLPERFLPQRRINESELPSPEEKLNILDSCIHALQQAGYVYIGMDHFAKPGDDLVEALNEGTLQRNFQGYSTYGNMDMLGLGVSSISYINQTFVQNYRDIEQYEQVISSGKLASFKGYQLNDDDLIRQRVIQELSCNGRLKFDALDEQFDIDSRAYFADEIRRLAFLADDGLVTVDNHAIQVTKAGRLLLRPICMVFDAYLQKSPTNKNRFSKVL
ncbi:oxygen-independent coproporphyrinogen III oxidase [Gynuella sunshinyii]|uniref:Coproporphyrinogen-III oxidase n=1 Tax=Gynuella sunshinyii YC6258 TaxID=1445510 RepID=A0A0C5V228_9GAMM|nr:oxygen-independent coproporphyrinogen III oxidase [Gynuella sunshinyii]AJQ93595.1 coproporphyrinogen III oxidase and related Fe-S oxidoreductase [Gynuella sunshinyii YC6258]